MFRKRGLLKRIVLLLVVVGVVVAFVIWIVSREQDPDTRSSVVDGGAICSEVDNDSVLLHNGTDYGACVSNWLFTIDVRITSRSYPDSRPITEAYLKSGTVPRCYRPPPMADVSGSGHCFRITETQLSRLGWPITDFHVVNETNVGEFVFVTGVSDSHYVESIDAIASIQQHMPSHKIIVYDLGLTTEQQRKMKTFCRVDVVHINLKDRSLYPRHVENLTTFAFKPLIIMETLKTYPAVVWIDSSARLHRSLDLYFPDIVKSGGLFLFAPPPKRSVVHHTHESTYDYFPTNRKRLRHTMILMPDGYYTRAEMVYWHALWWWALCALTEPCIHPCELKPCRPFDATNIFGYIGCHRYDMTVLNLLLANLHGYDYTVYGARRRIGVFEKLRKNTTFYKINICES